MNSLINIDYPQRMTIFYVNWTSMHAASKTALCWSMPWQKQFIRRAKSLRRLLKFLWWAHRHNVWFFYLFTVATILSA